MHIVTRLRLKRFWEKHPNSETSLRLWYKLASLAQWQSFAEVRAVFPSANQVGNLTVFNIAGNNYQLIVFIDYEYQKVFIRYVLTHAEYDKEN